MVGFQVHHALHTTWHLRGCTVPPKVPRCCPGPLPKKKTSHLPQTSVRGAWRGVLATMIRPCKPRDSARPALLTLNLQQAERQYATSDLTAIGYLIIDSHLSLSCLSAPFLPCLEPCARACSPCRFPLPAVYAVYAISLPDTN